MPEPISGLPISEWNMYFRKVEIQPHGIPEHKSRPMHEIDGVSDLTHPCSGLPCQQAPHSHACMCQGDKRHRDEGIEEYGPREEDIAPLISPANLEPRNVGNDQKRPGKNCHNWATQKFCHSRHIRPCRPENCESRAHQKFANTHFRGVIRT
ncbi:unannotated protein [freshwater metagenome]|uniref:Unannotated protein n=1 Tax=freshwater metagenome TaxID=449393 RepID=A0A6J6WTX0_9ZZZZ